MSTCATASRALTEPLSATAAAARTWLLIEQPGPWGIDALTGSHLDPRVGATLEAAAGAHGARVALIRRPGRHADHYGPMRRRLFIAHTAPGNSWVRTTVIGGDLARLGALDFAALGAGDHRGLWEPYTGDPLALVCTNGKRDRCCALLGRPLAGELAASRSANVWEITHIGGHRFAPTLLVLPYGYAYGRASAQSVRAVVDGVRAGHILTEGCRGRSAWPRPGQAADLAVREHTGETHADALTVVRTEGAAPHWTVTVAHVDGRRWGVGVDEVHDGSAAPTSCGAALGVPARMHVTGLAPATGRVTAGTRV